MHLEKDGILGDTDISLHIRILQGGYSPKVKTQSAKSWPKFHFRERGG